MTEIIKKVDHGKRNNIRGVIVHKVVGHDYDDKIELPILYSLDEGIRLYDRETMCEYLHDIIDNLEKHEELHHS
jgi:hypothetical protein